MYFSTPKNPQTVRVAAIQPGITEVVFQNPEMDHQERYDIVVQMTREAAAWALTFPAQIKAWVNVPKGWFDFFRTYLINSPDTTENQK
jgi:hypothetical protein